MWASIFLEVTILLMLVFSGCLKTEVAVKSAETEPPVTHPAEAPTKSSLITNGPSNIVLILDDLPDDFKLTNSTRKSSSHYVRFERGGNISVFLKQNPSFRGIVGLQNLVSKFGSIDAAVKAFNSDRNCAPNFMEVSSEIIGDESFVCKQSSENVVDFMVYFRKNNILSILDAGGINIDQNDAVKYAKIVESKITSETPTITTRPPTTTLPPATKTPTSIGLITTSPNDLLLTIRDISEAGWKEIDRGEDTKTTPLPLEGIIYFPGPFPSTPVLLKDGVFVVYVKKEGPVTMQVVKETVKAYPSIAEAAKEYSSILPTDVSTQSLGIADESAMWLEESVLVKAVFRKRNVVVVMFYASTSDYQLSSLNLMEMETWAQRAVKKIK